MKIIFLNPQGNFDRDDSYLTEHPDFGGQLVYVKEVALALARLGVSVDVVTRRIDDPDWPGFEQTLDDFGLLADCVRIVRLDCGGPGFLAKEALWPHLPRFAEAIVDFYREQMPHFATTHYADGGYLGALLQAHAGIGFTFTGHSLGAQKLDKLGASVENFEEIDARFRFSQRIAAERLSMQRSASIVTSTEDERRQQYAHPLYHGAIDPADDNRFRVIPPGINTDIFNQDAASDPRQWLEKLRAAIRLPDRPHIVVSSRLDAKKNVAGVVTAYIGCSELQQSAGLALFVRGVDDPWTELDQLKTDEQRVLGPILERIDAAGLRDRVSFINARSQRELAAAYRLFARQGSVFALPSLFEPFGLAPIEAAACGLAVVATCNGGPVEIFADGAGLLMDPEDPEDMARALRRGLAEHQTLAEAGIKRVLSTYTWDRTAQSYLDLIEHNLATGSEAAPPALPELDASALIYRHLAALDSKAP